MAKITEKTITLCGHGSNRPSLKNLYDYNKQRYSQIASNGKHKGVIAVRRIKGGLTEAQKVRCVSNYKTILGRNYYSQDRRSYCYTPYSNGLYYSDCSSSGCRTLDRIGISGVKSFNTESIYKSSLFESVSVKIEKGHILNPEILQIFDAIEYVGNDPSRPLQIGHVEWVYSIGSADETNSVVRDFQKFLNDNYSALIKIALGEDRLAEDGEYGTKTRRAALAVWKYMSNKYYGSFLTLTNPYFHDTCKDVAEKVTERQVNLHGTYGYILQGVLAGRGYFEGKITSKVDAATKDAIKRIQSDKGIKPTGELSEDVWYVLFN